MSIAGSTIAAVTSEKKEEQSQQQDDKEKKEIIRQINERNRIRLINAKKFAAFIR